MRRAAIVMLLIASSVTAQTDSTLARGDLARALLGFTGVYGPVPNLHVGRPGGRFDATYVPAGARVLGGGDLTLLLEFSSMAAAAHDAVLEHLRRKGLRDPRANTAEKGFLFGAGAGQPTMLESIELCQDSIPLSIQSQELTGRTLVHLRLGWAYKGSVCTPHRSEFDDRYQGEIEIPRLHPPPGARTSGGRVGGNSWSSTGEEDVGGMAGVSSTLSVAELLTHYASELTAAGWVAEPVAAGREAGVVVARKTSAKGRPMRAVLTDALDLRGAHALQLRIQMPARERAP
jgi:hypothetical protein